MVAAFGSVSAGRSTPAGETFRLDPADRQQHSFAAPRAIDSWAIHALDQRAGGRERCRAPGSRRPPCADSSSKCRRPYRLDPGVSRPGKVRRTAIQRPRSWSAEHDGGCSDLLRMRARKLGRDGNGRIQSPGAGRGRVAAAGVYGVRAAGMAALEGDRCFCRRIRGGGGDAGLPAGIRGLAEGDDCGRCIACRSTLGGAGEETRAARK